MATEILSVEITPFSPPPRLVHSNSGFHIIYDVTRQIDAKQKTWRRIKLAQPRQILSSTLESWNADPSALLLEFHRSGIDPRHHQELLLLMVKRVRNIMSSELSSLSAVSLLIKVTRKTTYSCLKRVMEEELGGGQVCSVCFEEIGKKDAARTVVCGHVFHCDCITQWIDKGRNCPLCRTMMPVSTKVLIEPSKPRKPSFVCSTPKQKNLLMRLLDQLVKVVH